MDHKYIELKEDSDAKTAYDALRQIAPKLAEHGEGYPGALSVETRRRLNAHSAPWLDEDIEVTAYVITWDHWSMYRGATIRRAAAIIDVWRGGLAPDGWAAFDRYAVRLPNESVRFPSYDDCIDALMLLAEEGIWPTAHVEESY